MDALNKIVFFDIDGTLLDFEKKLPSSTKEAIKSLQKKGVYTVLATGRAPFMVQSLLEELNIASYVCFNGQYVVFENEVVHAHRLDSNELKELEQEAAKHNHPVVYMTDSTLKANVEYDSRIAESLGTLHLDHPEYAPGFYEEFDVYQALLFAREEEASYIRSFEDDHSFIRWHRESMDVIPKGGSKAKGIKKVINRLGIQINDVYAFGDGLNDIEMLQFVGTGIAMGNAFDVVKEHADIITTHVEEDGIVNGLKKVGLLD